MAVRLFADDESGGPGLLVTTGGKIGHQSSGDEKWEYTAVMPQDTWWQFRFRVNESKKTYGLSYRTDAENEWVNLCQGVAYTDDLSFNGFDFFPHFGAAELPAQVYVDDVLVVTVAEAELAKEASRMTLTKSKGETEPTQAPETGDYWKALRRGADGAYGENRQHAIMPPLPDEPVDYVNMWDPFALRDTKTGESLAVTAQSIEDDRVLSGFDALPWNSRQITRDAKGNWLVLVEQDGGNLHLARGNGTSGNPYRPRGGDLTTTSLLGAEDSALIAGQEQASRASMAMDGQGSLHVVWHRPDGLWHAQTNPSTSSENFLENKEAWSAPKQLVKGACRAGDIMRDGDGAVVISYAQEDTLYYQSVSGGEAEVVGGLQAGMEPLALRGGKIPMSERECQDAVMDVANDGTVYLAFRRDLCIWVARRTPQGQWQDPARVAREYAYHPSIMVADGKPLVTFLHEGLVSIPLDIGEDLARRAGGGPVVSYATPDDDGWRTGILAAPEEIEVFRRGMFGKRFTGRILPQIEQLGWPVMFRDPQGVVWALWQNTTRRWSYCARWMGGQFGQVQECRGPFNAPRLPVMAEKLAPAGAGDVGVLFFAGAGGGDSRAIFDRIRIPSLSTTDDREVLFLDSLEVAQANGAEFVLNRMTKPSRYPSLSPRGENLTVSSPEVVRFGDRYMMRHSAPQIVDGKSKSGQGLAVSRDGVHFEPVDAIEGLPENIFDDEARLSRPLYYWKGRTQDGGQKYYLNPDQSDPDRKFIRNGYSVDNRGDYWVEYSSDGDTWTDKTPTTAAESIRERGQPNLFLPQDPERPIRTYNRVYTETGRAWGVIWSSDLLHWGGMEHLLDVDDPYGAKAAEVAIGNSGKHYNMRGQVYLDSVAGKGEEEIYGSTVHVAEGLYFCFYWPGRHGRPLTDVGIAVSRDGFNFTRVKNGERTLSLGPPGAWDSGQIFHMSPMLDGDQVRVFYRGSAARRAGTDIYNHFLTEIGVATIRVNGWTYYTPRRETGQATVTTIPIQSPAGTSRSLTVNVAGVTGKPSRFGVEVLDAATGETLEGFAPADCQMPSEDGVAVPVAWNGKAALPADRDIRLRFHMNSPGVRFYSFGFTDRE